MTNYIGWWACSSHGPTGSMLSKSPSVQRPQPLMAEFQVTCYGVPNGGMAHKHQKAILCRVVCWQSISLKERGQHGSKETIGNLANQGKHTNQAQDSTFLHFGIYIGSNTFSTTHLVQAQPVPCESKQLQNHFPRQGAVQSAWARPTVPNVTCFHGGMDPGCIPPKQSSAALALV